MSTFNIPDNSLTDAIAPARSLALSGLFGIGIRIAEAKSKKPSQGNDYQKSDNQQFPYAPDALPNKNGGYDKTSGWNGRMSSSLSGMPVLCYLKFVGGNYIDLRGNSIQIPDIEFETILISLSMNKNIEKTKITGRNGQVREFIGIDDFTVELSVAITNDAPVNNTIQKTSQDGAYPRENMAEIWRMLQAPISIPVECWFLEQFDIKYLCVGTSAIRIDQVAGDYSTQRMTIPCESDTPLIIKIAN